MCSNNSNNITQEKALDYIQYFVLLIFKMMQEIDLLPSCYNSITLYTHIHDDNMILKTMAVLMLYILLYHLMITHNI